ncbi:protein kinase [Streptomyces sp. NPDC047706]|uniref:protein kinase domain-containing protein n=1 Tax=Streptomyces sp. NPDC047706 TaxID=3365486 RepID=UPI00371F5724
MSRALAGRTPGGREGRQAGAGTGSGVPRTVPRGDHRGACRGGFHTAPVVDADPDASAPWLATAYVPGPTLAELLAAQGPMGGMALRQLGLALAEALQAIHDCGLVHRDLKPGNIIMAHDGPRVVDFGIARAVEGSRLTVTGIAVGTPGFLAPEQAEGHPVSPAADVFALGAVLVAAAGGSAFGEGTPAAMMYRSVHHEPDLTAVPSARRRRRLHGQVARAAAHLRATAEHARAPRRPAAVRRLPAHLGGPLRATAADPCVPSGTPKLPPTADAGTEEPQLLAMDRRNAVVADTDGISLGNNGRTTHLSWSAVRAVTYDEKGRGLGLTVTVHLADGVSHSCRVTTRDEEVLDEWIDQVILVREHFLPGP